MGRWRAVSRACFGWLRTKTRGGHEGRKQKQETWYLLNCLTTV